MIGTILGVGAFVAVLGLAACAAVPAFKPDTSVTKPAVGRPAPPSSVQAATSSEAFTPYAQLGQSNDDGLAPGESFSARSKACLTDAGFPNADGPGTGIGFVIAFGGLLASVPFGRRGYLGVAEAGQDGFTVRSPGSSSWPRGVGPKQLS